ncbi:bifunctional DNA-binding transcriptional regulator/O6-methylguanine-DNA methyltransferase Ada [Pelagibius sp. Alg239-R121]|uniref:bifunctional DNA-binding transcriptional regulator/O6-methylguanine-DNA methyltransferase Ada n=1 Tax=Pelagibius sp. Alg239-R121 TaxID=2993448 RepID=UPI0024A6E469|nr:bifunctional DNA-binding transcriptional regulator/O6-methylguanine-DNA methyltransferase Ada [Pelagibius sp. Alg239-R121]
MSMIEPAVASNSPVAGAPVAGTSAAGAVSAIEDFASEEARWTAVLRRDEAAEGRFWFSVATTGVYCRPSCAARQPRRENVAFYDYREAAEKAGFRPCKRCRPELPPRAERHRNLVAVACTALSTSEVPPSLSELAADAGLSPHHFHRLFKATVGITPKQYAAAHRAGRMKQALDSGTSITEAIYDAGYGGNSRFYEQADARLGMTASSFKKGGRGMSIRYGTAQSCLGPVLVAATERGICAILFGEDRGTLKYDLHARFPEASFELAETESDFQIWIEGTLAFLKAPQAQFELPLDIAGTAFQEQVWQALRSIPPGKTASYAEVADAIGKPKSVRAVARACGANPVAVAIPCHRVVRSDGGLGGYRWGVDRKENLLTRERAA